MSEPSVELQRGIYSALTGSAALTAAASNGVRVYDRVPAPAVFPYITISDAQVIDDGNSCEPDQFEVFADLHVWSRAVGMAEAKTIAGVIRSVLLAITSVSNWTVSVADFQTARHFADPDGLTTHSVVTFRFLLQPPDQP